MELAMTSKTPAMAVRIVQLREWIAQADLDGLPRSDMQLHLSHRDLSGLKRSPDVQMEEITFFSGVMRFLGVEVVAAATSASTLDRRLPA
jgi:hypothetical protein